MALRDVVSLSPTDRRHRRDVDEMVFHRVETLLNTRLSGRRSTPVGEGPDRCAAFGVVSVDLDMQRGDVVAAYWRHRQRLGYRNVTPRTTGSSRGAA